MASETDYFLSLRPVYPWSVYPFGLPALCIVAAIIVGLTLWAYLRHPSASRSRIAIVLALRLLALAIALLTTLRPSLGIQEDPKLPSTLLVGIDLSESMSIKDEFNSQTRIAAVHTILEKCVPLFEELRAEQNVNVSMYAVGRPDFNEALHKYDPAAAPDIKRSDYGSYFNRTFDKWQTERFVRGHLLIGDGADNGTTYAAIAEAARWRAICPIHTFSVGSTTTPPNARDIAITAVAADPTPVPVKNDVTIKVLVNAFGFQNARVPVRVLFDDKQVALEEFTLTKVVGNEVSITVKAPEKPGEVKVRVEIPIDKVPGDVAPANNVVETYMTVTKEGVRVLLVDRLRIENTLLRDVLRSEKRFDVAEVLRQGDDPGTAEEREFFDFDTRSYDVIILGNISAKQLQAIDPKLAKRIRDQVVNKGAGLLLMGGDASFTGNPDRPLDGGWKGSPIEEILPVSLDKFPAGVNDDIFRGENKRFQTVPTDKGLDFLMKVAPNRENARELWDRLNGSTPGVPTNRMTAIAKLGEPRVGSTVYAVAADGRDAVPGGQVISKLKPPYLMVGWQFDGSNKGRVMAFAGYDTFLWKPFGMRNLPRTRDGIEIHAQFWRRLVLWLAHQEEEEGAAFARPAYRRLPVQGQQSIKLGLRGAGGADALDPKFEVRVIAPGQKPEEAPVRPIVADAAGGSKVLFDPQLPGEYIVTLKAIGKDGTGKEVKGDATARFLAYAETSDELLRSAADHDYLDKLAKAGGGKAFRLEDLPTFLKELKTQKPEGVKPKPRFLPDWRRNHSHGFLTGWLIAFAILLGIEWGLRRMWGMV